MHCWYYDKKELRNTPSALDGIDYETECRYRKEGARFIQDTGTKIKLGYNTMATGVVYFHRFYMFHSFRQFPRYVTACCCLFLAGKVEETPKKCRDIIETAQSLLTPEKFSSFGEDPREEVMTLERILLQTIKFDFQVEHPYSSLLRYAKCLKGDKAKLQKMLQMAWTFVNDSLCTTLVLQYEPEIIAVALMYLAGRLSKFEVMDWIGRTERHLRWWDLFVEDLTMDILEDVCHQVLDLYSQTPNISAPESPPAVPRTLIQTGTTSAVTNASPIPVKISSSSASLTSRKNGQDFNDLVDTISAAVKNMPPPPDMSAYQYGYPGAPPLGAYPSTFTASIVPPIAAAHLPAPPPGPPPHIAPPPPPTVYPPYVPAPPPHYPPPVVGPPPSFYQSSQPAPPSHRPYYPPPN